MRAWQMTGALIAGLTALFPAQAREGRQAGDVPFRDPQRDTEVKGWAVPVVLGGAAVESVVVMRRGELSRDGSTTRTVQRSHIYWVPDLSGVFPAFARVRPPTRPRPALDDATMSAVGYQPVALRWCTVNLCPKPPATPRR
jgi:hypothetical protein